MKTIGLIGGVSWFSTAEYYKRLHKIYGNLYGGVVSPSIMMCSLNFDEILTYQLENNISAEFETLQNAAEKLVISGADVILICSNTTSRVAGALQVSIKVPIINIVEATARKVVGFGKTKALLLGTKMTMEGDFYSGFMKKCGVQILTPDEKDRATIHDIIYSELCKGMVTRQSQKYFINLIEKHSHTDIPLIILGCTELPLLLPQKYRNPKILDSIDVHINEALRFLNVVQ